MESEAIWKYEAGYYGNGGVDQSSHYRNISMCPQACKNKQNEAGGGGKVYIYSDTNICTLIPVSNL